MVNDYRVTSGRLESTRDMLPGFGCLSCLYPILICLLPHLTVFLSRNVPSSHSKCTKDLKRAQGAAQR